MDFALETLTDAFSRSSFREGREGYRLYGFLLATGADHELFPGILAHLDELHYLTGKHILLLSPRVNARVRGRSATSEQIRRILVTGSFPQWFGGTNEPTSMFGRSSVLSSKRRLASRTD